MRGEEIGRARIDVRLVRVRFELGIASHRGEEAHCAVRVVSGARRDADADTVRLELLRAREACERDLGFGERQRAGLRIAAAGRCTTRVTSATWRAWSSRMAAWRAITCDISWESTEAELGSVVGERDQSARDVELSGRQREGVDRRRIEDGDAVLQVRPLGSGDQLLHRLVEQAFELGILVGAVVGGEDALMLALGGADGGCRWAAVASGQRPGRRLGRRAGSSCSPRARGRAP